MGGRVGHLSVLRILPSESAELWGRIGVFDGWWGKLRSRQDCYLPGHARSRVGHTGDFAES